MKKLTILLPFLFIGGCSFFNPSVELTNEELFEQYKFNLSKVVDIDLIRSVKSYDCKFLGYAEPDFKSTPTFGCKVILEPSEPEKYEDVEDEAILARHGINGKKTHLEKSKFIEKVSEEAFKQTIQK